MLLAQTMHQMPYDLVKDVAIRAVDAMPSVDVSTVEIQMLMVSIKSSGNKESYLIWKWSDRGENCLLGN